MFTADEYRTAAKLAREAQPNDAAGDLADQWEARAKKLDAIQQHATELGFIGSADAPYVRGPKLLVWLKEQGWTPPKGLL